MTMRLGAMLMLAVLPLAGCGGSKPVDESKAAVAEVYAKPLNEMGGTLTDVQFGDWQPGTSSDKITTTYSATIKSGEALVLEVERIEIPADPNDPAGKPEVVSVVRELLPAGTTSTATGRIEASKMGKIWTAEAEPSEVPFQKELAKAMQGAKVGWGVKAGKRSEFAGALTEGATEVEAARTRRQDRMKAIEEFRVAQQEREKREREAKAEAERQAKLAPLWAPFEGEHGAIAYGPPGMRVGALITKATVDKSRGTVSGEGISLSKLPPEPFTFTGSAKTSWGGQATLSVRFSDRSDDVEYPAGTGGAIARNDGLAIAALTRDERASLDAHLEEIRSCSAKNLSDAVVESIDAKNFAGWLTQRELTKLPGIITLNGEAQGSWSKVFSGQFGDDDVAIIGRGWVGLRLNDPVRAKGMVIAAHRWRQSNNVVVIVNGVLRGRINQLPGAAGVVLTFPTEVEVFDVRFEVAGVMSPSMIRLLK